MPRQELIDSLEAKVRAGTVRPEHMERVLDTVRAMETKIVVAEARMGRAPNRAEIEVAAEEAARRKIRLEESATGLEAAACVIAPATAAT